MAQAEASESLDLIHFQQQFLTFGSPFKQPSFEKEKELLLLQLPAAFSKSVKQHPVKYSYEEICHGSPKV